MGIKSTSQPAAKNCWSQVLPEGELDTAGAPSRIPLAFSGCIFCFHKEAAVTGLMLPCDPKNRGTLILLLLRTARCNEIAYLNLVR